MDVSRGSFLIEKGREKRHAAIPVIPLHLETGQSARQMSAMPVAFSKDSDSTRRFLVV